jgi:hypothetical protein
MTVNHVVSSGDRKQLSDAGVVARRKSSCCTTKGRAPGCAVHGARIVTARLAEGDLVRLGRVEFRFDHVT